MICSICLPRGDEPVLGQLGNGRVDNVFKSSTGGENSPLPLARAALVEDVAQNGQLVGAAEPLGHRFEFAPEFVQHVAQRAVEPLSSVTTTASSP